jgi:hypothetical protein
MTNKYFSLLLFALLVAVILLLWFDRGNNKRVIKRADKVFADSVSVLQDILLLTEIEVDRHKDTIQALRKERGILVANSSKSRTVKIRVLNEPKIIVPDSVPQIVKNRIFQDSVKIESLIVYGADLEAENANLNKIVTSQEHENKALEVMNETNKLMIAQLDARHDNDQELFKNERKLKRKWIVTSAGVTALLVLSIL